MILLGKNFKHLKTIKKHRLHGADFSNGRGSWTRTNACWIQNPVPYQLGDTPKLLRINIDYYIAILW